MAVGLVGVLLVAGGAIVLTSSDQDREGLLVMTTFYPLYYFSSEIGGDRAEVRMLIPDNAEPHSWEPKPSDIINMGRADIFVYNGQGFEPWLDSFLSSVANQDLVVVDTSKNIDVQLTDEVRDLYDHAVRHLVNGPNSTVTAAASPSEASVMDVPHGRLNVTFVPHSGEMGGHIVLSISVSGDYQFFLTRDVPMAITGPDGAAVEFEDEVDPVADYPQFAGQKVVELEEGKQYNITFGPTAEAYLDIVILGGAGHDHDHEHEDEHEHDHEHGINDPHFWLDPLSAKVQVDNILKAFVEKDPSNATYYQQNAADLKERLDALHQEFEAGLEGRTKDSIITTHEGFNYLAKRYGFTAYAAIGISGDEQPSPQDMIELTDLVNDLGLNYVYSEPIYNDAVINTIAHETGAEVLILDSLHGRTGQHEGMDYFQIMRENLKNLRTGLEVPS